MIVYRVEDSLKRGPYRGPISDLLSISIPKLITHGKENGRPSPIEDGINVRRAGKVCGFASKNALNRWFEETQDKLRFHGFHISIYSVHNTFVNRGKYQLVFTLDEAKLVRTLKLRKRRKS